MKINEFAQEKADRLGIELIRDTETFNYGTESETFDIVRFSHDGKEYICSSDRQLEDQLDDLLDGGFFRAAQAADDAKREDLIYGPMD